MFKQKHGSSINSAKYFYSERKYLKKVSLRYSRNFSDQSVQIDLYLK